MSIVDLMHQLIFQMSAFIFSESALVLFEGVFTLGVFLSAKTIRKPFSYEQPLHCKYINRFIFSEAATGGVL